MSKSSRPRIRAPHHLSVTELFALFQRESHRVRPDDFCGLVGFLQACCKNGRHPTVMMDMLFEKLANEED